MSARTHAERLFSRILHFVQVGQTTAPPNDTGAVQTVQFKPTPASVRDAVPVVFHYGFSSSMPVGSAPVAIHVSGDSSKGMIIACGSQQYRIRGLPSGGVALYDMSGSSIVLDGVGGMVAKPAGGTMTVDGTLAVMKDVVIAGKSFIGHEHGGVQSGDGKSGVPI